MKRLLRSATFAAASSVLALGAWGAWAQNTTTTVKPDGSVETTTVRVDVQGPRMQIYGFVQLDMSATTSTQSTPTGSTPCDRRSCRPSRTSSARTADFYAACGRRRFGVKGWLPTGRASSRPCFEFDLFGVGVDAGQTTIRAPPRLWRARTRSARARPRAPSWTSTSSRTRSSTGARTGWSSSGTSRFAGCRCRATRASDDRARAARRERATAASMPNRVELQNVKARFPLPDLSAQVPAATGKWGHVQLAGILRDIEWDDTEHRRSSTSPGARPAGA